MRGFYTLYVTIKTIKEIKEILDEVKGATEKAEEAMDIVADVEIK